VKSILEKKVKKNNFLGFFEEFNNINLATSQKNFKPIKVVPVKVERYAIRHNW